MRSDAPRRQAVGVEEEGADAGAAGAEGVGLDGDTGALGAGPLEQREHPVDVPARGAVHMAVVHVRPGLGRGAHDLLRAVDRGGRIGLDELAGVGVRGRPGLGGETRHGEVLVGADARRIADEDADAESAVAELGAHPGEDPLHVASAGLRLPGGVADLRQHSLEPALRLDTGEDLHAGHRPGRGEAEVQRPPVGGGRGVRHTDGVEPGLELERRGHPVERLETMAGHRLRMAVEVDEPRSDDQPGGVDDLGGGLLCGGAHGHDAVVRDHHIGHLVAARLGIDDPPPADHGHARHAGDRTRCVTRQAARRRRIRRASSTTHTAGSGDSPRARLPTPPDAPGR